MIEIIKSLKDIGCYVTVYDLDVSASSPTFVLAVKMDSPLDMWYISKHCKECGYDMGLIDVKGDMLFFTDLDVNADAYRVIVNEQG